ncbi:hypothetical protein QCA50_015435 [Cerrena zonata]|uniref:Uncharacterized protein n=1 Tax=Cerrena zonata TaxID=2478898 RepID=A0AAW0FP56_9APHY
MSYFTSRWPSATYLDLTTSTYVCNSYRMSGALSGHLLESFMLAQTPRGPFGQSTPQVMTSGAMAFAPSMHGTFSQLPSMLDHSALMELSEETSNKIAEMQAKLNKKLGPEYISQRPGPGGALKLTYAEGWKIINLANEVFGFNGWSSSVVNLTTDFVDYLEETKRFNVGVTAVVRVTLRDGVFHEDVGYGMLENSKSKGAALDKCKKEAVTDGVKRALRNFGNLLGNCLYDKSYTQEIVKIKVPPPKFNRDELHRRPEFAEPKLPAQTNGAGPSTSAYTPIVKSEPQQPVAGPSKPQAIPPHMRPNMGNVVTPSKPPANAPKPMSNISLNTPITPANFNTNRPAAPSRPPMNPPPQVQSKPAPPQAPPPTTEDKHVTFVESQDEYDFGSDDAFYAAVDLDVLGDAGIGGHIDFDEGMGGVSGIEEDISMDVDRSVQAISRPAGPQQSIQPMQQKQVAPQQPQQQSRPPQSKKTRMEILEEYERERLAKEQENERQQQQQQSSKQVNNSASSGAVPSTPMGGFRFPTTSNVNQGGRPTGQNSARTGTSNFGSSTGNGLGLKRTFDTAQSGQRRPVQGMGLAQATSGKREPLGALEIGDGGDVKRLKR